MKPPENTGRARGLVAGALLVALFITMGVWGGIPGSVSIGGFIFGIAVLVFFILLFSFLGWHLLVRPLPAGTPVPEGKVLPAIHRHLIAFIMGLSGLSFIVGAFWDEVWHVQYGFPFGEDFFWRPHLMMYASILTFSALALFGLIYIIKSGSGTLQQRFRRNPTLGLLVLIGGFFLYTIIADPIWHVMYGDDLSAWSIPHVVLVYGFLSTLFLAVAIQVSTRGARAWEAIGKFSNIDALVIGVMGIAMHLLLQFSITDWELARGHIVPIRPDWLLPVMIVSWAGLFGTMINHALRYAGVSTLAGFLNLIVHFILIEGFSFDRLSMSAWTWILFPLFVIDLWYAYSFLRSKRPPLFLSSGIAAMIGIGVLALPQLKPISTFLFTQVTSVSVPLMVVFGIIAGSLASFVGATIGDALARGGKESSVPISPSFRLLQFVLLIGVIVFIVFFVATSAPPA